MSWLALTEANLLTTLSSSELEGYRAAALATGQDDPVTPTMSLVTDLVRGYVAASGRYLLGVAGTLPEKLFAPALDIIAFRIPARVGQDAEQSRKTLNDQAIKLLEQVAKGDYGIEEPTVPDTVDVISNPSPLFVAKTLSFTRDDEEGI
jgi:hypothetical protein